MADHDELCPQRHQYRGHKSRCVCALLAAARADERERIVAELDGPAQESEAMYAHAEAVAARLVEVICDDEHWRELLEAKLDRISLMWRAACKERDAARAEVAALRKQEWAAPYRREVLADLRAKVEDRLAYERKKMAEASRRDDRMDHVMAGLDVARREVLALIEEASNG